MILKTTTIKQKVFITAQPEEVYDAYISAKKHAAFTGAKATSVAKAGGKFTAWDGYISGKNVTLVKGSKIVQEWKTTEWPEGYPPSILDLTFARKKGGTEIVMVHSGVPDQQSASYKQGWNDYYWTPLRIYFKNTN